VEGDLNMQIVFYLIGSVVGTVLGTGFFVFVVWLIDKIAHRNNWKYEREFYDPAAPKMYAERWKKTNA
jgi:hypothetical protein